MAEFAVNLNAGKTDEKGMFRLLGKLFNQSGIVESTAMTVAAQASPDMTVRITGSAASDNAVFLTTNADCYHGWNTASYNVTITANASGVTKKDTVIAYIDTAAGSATANNPAGLKFVAVRGSGTDTAPTDGEVNTAISSKPFIRLANVQVSNGAASINSGNITDVRTSAATMLRGHEFVIPLCWNSGTLTNASYTTLDTTRTTIDFSKYPSLAAAYFEVNLNTGGANTAFCQFYNVTDGAAIASSEVSTTSVGGTAVRSSDIKGSLPTASKLMAIQTKISVSSAFVINSARLVLQF